MHICMKICVPSGICENQRVMLGVDYFDLFEIRSLTERTTVLVVLTD